MADTKTSIPQIHTYAEDLEKARSSRVASPPRPAGIITPVPATSPAIPAQPEITDSIVPEAIQKELVSVSSSKSEIRDASYEANIIKDTRRKKFSLWSEIRAMVVGRVKEENKKQALKKLPPPVPSTTAIVTPVTPPKERASARQAVVEHVKARYQQSTEPGTSPFSETPNLLRKHELHTPTWENKAKEKSSVPPLPTPAIEPATAAEVKKAELKPALSPALNIINPIVKVTEEKPVIPLTPPPPPIPVAKPIVATTPTIVSYPPVVTKPPAPPIAPTVPVTPVMPVMPTVVTPVTPPPIQTAPPPLRITPVIPPPLPTPVPAPVVPVQVFPPLATVLPAEPVNRMALPPEDFVDTPLSPTIETSPVVAPTAKTVPAFFSVNNLLLPTVIGIFVLSLGVFAFQHFDLSLQSDSNTASNTNVMFSGATRQAVVPTLLTKENIIGQIAAAEIPDATVTEIHLLTTFGGERIAGATIFEFLKFGVSAQVKANVKLVTFGYYRNQPWVLLEVADATTMRGGLLQWEPSLRQDLSPLFTYTTENRDAKLFRDDMIDSTDVRIHSNPAEEDEIVYGFITPTTVLLTTDSVRFLNLQDNFRQ